MMGPHRCSVSALFLVMLLAFTGTKLGVNSAGKAEAVVLIAEGVKEGIKGITNVVQRDGALRDNFAKNTAAALVQKFPGYSAVVAAKNGRISGRDARFVEKQHLEMRYTLGTSQGYEVYLIPRGKCVTFRRDGPGGYENWAIQGVFERGKTPATEAEVKFPNAGC